MHSMHRAVRDALVFFVTAAGGLGIGGAYMVKNVALENRDSLEQCHNMPVTGFKPDLKKLEQRSGQRFNSVYVVMRFCQREYQTCLDWEYIGFDMHGCPNPPKYPQDVARSISALDPDEKRDLRHGLIADADKINDL